MLAEAIITSTIVLTTLVGLYANFMKLYNVYKIRDTYYDIDGVYAIKNAIDAMINDGSLAGTLVLNSSRGINTGSTSNDTTDYTADYKILISGWGDKIGYNKTCFSVNSNSVYCNFLKNTYNIENMYVVKYDEESIGKLKDRSGRKLRQTFKDYLGYVKKYYNFNMDEDNKYSYLFVVEYKKNDKYYYSSLGVR